MVKIKEDEKEALKIVAKTVATKEGRSFLAKLGHKKSMPIIAVNSRIRTSRLLDLTSTGKEIFVAVVIGDVIVDGFIIYSGRK